MLNEKQHEMVLFSGYAKVPVGITAAEVYKVIGLVVVVDVETGIITEADCTLATKVARDYVSKLLIGYDLSKGSEGIQTILDRKYQGNAKKAISTALRIIHDKYRSFKTESEIVSL